MTARWSVIYNVSMNVGLFLSIVLVVSAVLERDPEAVETVRQCQEAAR
jgi:hypothetical protein